MASRGLLLIVVWSLPLTASARLNLFACEPEWLALAEQIGGEKVEAVVATTAAQDPHHIEARPSLISRLRRADLLLCTGAELEVGWLPMLLRRASNPGVQPGMPGSLLAADHVTLLEVPQRLDRSDGDVHAAGNPHLVLDPRNVLTVAQVLAARLAGIDSANAAYYQQRLADFEQRWSAAIDRWEQRAAPLRGKQVVVHHRSWSYLLNWLGIESIGELEPRPGLPVSVGHLATLAERVGRDQPLAIIRATIDDPAPAEWLAGRTQIPQLVLPRTVGADAAASDLESWFDRLIDRLLAAQR